MAAHDAMQTGASKMATYNFSANGLDFGNYDGNTVAEAAEAFAQDAGYKSWAFMVDQAEDNGGNNVEIREVQGAGPATSVDFQSNNVVVAGQEVSFDAAVALMDDDIRESIHDDIAPCSSQAFVNAYANAHRAKYGAAFAV